MFVREDWTLFRSVDTLPQKAGVAKEYLAALIAKELTDNALDTGAKVEIGLREGGFYVQDYGQGIPADKITELFSINRPLQSTKLLRLPMRGAMGNGLRVVTGAVLATGGSLAVSTQGYKYRLTPQTDGRTLAEVMGKYDLPGTRIDITLGKAAGRVDLSWAKRAVLLASGDYYKGRTSPYWYTATAFHELFLAAESLSVRELIAMFDGCTGTKAGRIAAEYKNRSAQSITKEESNSLLQAMREQSSQVKPERLGAVGLIESLPDNYAKSTGFFTLQDSQGGIDAHIPFICEVWANIANESVIYAHVNRTAITGDIRAYHSKTELSLYGCSLSHSMNIGRNPMEIWLNVITPYMPITTDGKEPDFSLLINAGMYDAINKAVGKAKRRHSAIVAIDNKARKQNEIIDDCLTAAIDKAGGAGQYRFSQRQLYYAVRPYVIGELGRELDYNYFCKILTEYENVNGDIAGLYRDERGTLYHPHTGETIPVGTLSVEEYQRPEWTFNKILYAEKEGFFPILRAAKWPERHDCALLTSKGYASRAARDLLDMMDDTGEEIQMFCIHDSDAAGTMIYQSLQEATSSRHGRSVKIINLGLEPVEALTMNLEVEKVSKKQRLPVADYVPSDVKEWLQNNRVELNAMSTPVFLQWLDNKMLQYSNGKLIPPQRVLTDTLHDRAQQEVKRRIVDDVLKATDINGMTDRRMSEISVMIEQQAATLTDTIVNVLGQEPANSWRGVVDRVAGEVAGGTDHL